MAKMGYLPCSPESHRRAKWAVLKEGGSLASLVERMLDKYGVPAASDLKNTPIGEPDSVLESEQDDLAVTSTVGAPTAREIALEFAKVIARPTEDVTILAIRREVLSVLLAEQEKQASTKPTKKK